MTISSPLPLTELPLPLSPGQVIGERYRVNDVLGGGGMGVVFSGTHVLLGTPVAIKLIHSELKHDGEAVQRFLNEARTSASLKGEHIARVFDVGILDSGEPYLVMEQLDGLGLDQYLQERGACSPTEAVDLVLQVCEGLAEAHAAALVHRDIKPANLFLARRADGQFSLKILDFGIVKHTARRRGEPGLTNPGKSLGSPWYMSPEQMMTPHTVDQRADVWSLGVLLFELLTDQLPFVGDDVPQVCANVLTAPVPPVRHLRPELPPELEAIVQRCLEKDPTARFQSVDQLAAALLPFASPPSYSSGLALDAAATRAERKSRRSPSSYGSLRPLGTDSQRPEPRRSSWPSTLGLALLALLILGGGLHYSDPTLLPRAVHAARSQERQLPWNPQLQAGPAATELVGGPVTHAPASTLHMLRAIPEVEREPAGEKAGEQGFAPDPHTTALNYEAWLRSQGLQRIR